MERTIEQTPSLSEVILPIPTDEDYWSFHGRSEREFAHAYLQYPAMMVPQMQGELIDHICKAYPHTRHVWDPFVGSGTSLGECMLRGLDFTGNDINPLAVLVSKTKSGPLNIQAIREKKALVFERINSDRSEKLEVTFPGRDKWFSREVSVRLSRIRRAICAETSLWARRFFWVALAETIRLTSNSRTSTFKLHIRAEEDLAKARKDPLQVFRSTVENNVEHLSAFCDRLKDAGYAKHGRYAGKTEISLLNTSDLPTKFLKDRPADLIVTSPPYGDNQTTIPYGQYSYLPLNWIPLDDIDSTATAAFLETTCAIDSMSLGGSRRGASEKANLICQKSATFSALYQTLKDTSNEAQKKVASFFHDLDCCIDPLLDRLAPGGNMAWTLGNRTVANTTVPLDVILLELFATRGVRLTKQLARTIPTKRMAGRNSVSNTMTRETVFILQKPNSNERK